MGAGRLSIRAPFPLYRLPSSLRRDITQKRVSRDEQFKSPTKPKQSPSRTPKSRYELDPNSISIDFFPSIRNSAFFWTYTRLICGSLLYISGMAFYDATSATLSAGHKRVHLYDVLETPTNVHFGKHSEEKEFRRLSAFWAITIALLTIVTVCVYWVVKLSEKAFAYQLAAEIERCQRIEEELMLRCIDIRSESEKESDFATSSQPIENTDNANVNSAQKPHSSTYSIVDKQARINKIQSEEERIKAQAEFDDEQSRNRITSQMLDTIEHRKRCSKRGRSASISSDSSGNSLDSEYSESSNDEDEDEDELNAELLDSISTRTLFTYRLLDLLSYYLIFIAVFALQNTLQMTFVIPFNNTLSVLYLYLAVLMFVSVTIAHILTLKFEKINSRLVQLYSMNYYNGSEYRELRISQAAWRKLSSYIISSFSYLLAYAYWSVIVGTLAVLISDDSIRSQKGFIWCSAFVICFVGATIIVLLNIRIKGLLRVRDPSIISDGRTQTKYSSISTNDQNSTNEPFEHSVDINQVDHGNLTDAQGHNTRNGFDNDNSNPPGITGNFHTILNILAYICCGRCCSFPNRLFPSIYSDSNDSNTRNRNLNTDSIASLQVQVDVLEGSVTSNRHQLATEAFSYIVALALSSALTSLIPAAPNDASTYLIDPTSKGLVTYAILCTTVLSIVTLYLEKSIQRSETEYHAQNKLTIQRAARNHIEQQLKLENLKTQATSPTHRPTQSSSQIQVKRLKSMLSCDIDEEYERRNRARRKEDEKRKQEERLKSQRKSTARSVEVVDSDRVLNGDVNQSAVQPDTPILPSPDVVFQIHPPNIIDSSTPLVSSSIAPPLEKQSSSSSNISSSSLNHQHEHLLISTFWHEWYLALCSTLVQGFSLMVAYAW